MEEEVRIIPGDTRETVVTTTPGRIPGVTEVTTKVIDTHVVSEGETLSEITQAKTGDGSYSSYMEVAEANDIENPNLIYVGDEIEYTVSESTRLERNNGPVPMDERPMRLEATPSGSTSGNSVISTQHANSGSTTNLSGTSSTGGASTPNVSGGSISGTLGIDRATIGYDKMGMQAAVNKLNLIVFNGAAVAVRNAIPMVNIAVDQCWAGQSADAFKAKFARDAEVMCETLTSLEEEVRGQFAQIAQNVDNYDGAIAESFEKL